MSLRRTASPRPPFPPNALARAIVLLCACPLGALAQEASDQRDTASDTSLATPDSSAPSAPSAATRLGEVTVNAKPKPSNEPEFNGGVSTVGAKAPAAIRDIPQTVTVVNRAVLDSQHATSLVDALRNVPGITISAGEGGQIGNNINLRGFSARTDIYLDGFRDRGQYQRDVFSLDAVEVLEGSSSLLFGRGSTGGIINQVSKRPTLTPVGEFDVSLGTDNDYRSTLDVGHKLDDHSAFRLALMGQKVDATRDVVQLKDYGFAPSIAFGLGTDTEVTLSLLSQHNDDIPDYGFPLVRFSDQSAARPIDAPHRRYYGYSNDVYDQDVNVFNLSAKHSFGEGLSLRSNSQYSIYRTQAAATPLGGLQTLNSATGNYSTMTVAAAGTPLDQLNSAVQQRDRAIRDSSLFNQTDLSYKRRLGWITNTLTVGSEIGRDEYVNNYAAWYNFNFNNGAGLGANTVDIFNLGSAPNRAKPSGANVYRVPGNYTETNADTLAAYFNDQVDLGRNWKVVAGLRWDQYAAEQRYLNYCYANAATCPNVAVGTLADPNSGLITSNSDASQASAVAAHNGAVLQNPNPALQNFSSQHTDYHLSTRAGLIYQPDDAQSYYASFGTSFDPLAEAVAGLPTSGATATQYANASAPEKNKSYEIGGKWDFYKSRLSLDGALFQVEKTNARTLDPTTSVYTLDGNIRVRGGELKVVGQILPHWQVLGGYTYLNGKILQSPVAGNQGSIPQNTPRHSAAVWNTYDFLPSWQIGGGVVFSSDVFTNNTETAIVPSYTRYDATLAYHRSKYTLRMNLQNLTNEFYFQSISGGRATPADGRRLIVTGSYDFL